MASQSISKDTRTELETLLKQWGARWRLQQVVRYLPRIVMASLAVGIVVAAVIALARALPTTQMLVLVSIAVSTSFALAISAIGLFGKDNREAARQFDSLFDLQERMSTALELLDGRIQTTSEISQRQLQDTYEMAQNVSPKKMLPLRVKWIEWAGALGVLILLVIVLIFAVVRTADLGNGGVGAETQGAITAAADTARDITEDIASDSGLTDEERSALLDSTEQTLAELESPQTNGEDSFIAMSELEADLREQAESIQNEALESENSLQAAADALGSETGASPSEQLAQDLSELGASVDSMSEEERAELQRRLEEAAEQVEETNPQLASALGDASNSLQSGDTEAMQEALDNAAQEAQASGSQNQARTDTSESLQEAADNAAQAAQDVASSEFSENAQEIQADAPSSQQGSGSQPQDQQQQQQSSNSGSQGEEGQDGQESENGNTASGEEGTQLGDATGDGEDSGSEDEMNSGQGENSGEGGGSGDSQAQQTTQEIVGSQSPDQAADTGSDASQEGEYEAIFAPQNSDNVPTGNDNVELEADSSGAPSIEGEFQQNPDGTSNVPYNQIFTDYADVANSALENGYVPLGVRDVVRDYFISIEPTGGE